MYKNAKSKNEKLNEKLIYRLPHIANNLECCLKIATT